MGTILDTLHQTTERFIMESGFNVKNPQLHIHPADNLELAREVVEYFAEYTSNNRCSITGLDMELVINTFCKIGDPVIIEEKEIMRLPSSGTEFSADMNSKLPKYTISENVVGIKNYHHEIIIPIAIPNPHQQASETLYAQKRMELDSKRLIGNRIDHKICLTESSFILSISEDDMYKYFFIDGVTGLAINRSGDFAKSKVKDFIDKRVEEIRYKWKLEDTARYYDETGFIPIDETLQSTKIGVDLAYGSDHSVDTLGKIRGKHAGFIVVDDLEDIENDPEKVKAYYDMLKHKPKNEQNG